MYERMIECWNNYQQAMKAKPYDPDKVQAWGIAFADQYHKNKDDICEQFGFNPDEWDYNMKSLVMEKVLCSQLDN